MIVDTITESVEAAAAIPVLLVVGAVTRNPAVGIAAGIATGVAVSRVMPDTMSVPTPYDLAKGRIAADKCFATIMAPKCEPTNACKSEQTP